MRKSFLGKRIGHGLAAAVLSISLLLGLACTRNLSVKAAEPADDVKRTISIQYDLSDVNFSVYKIADLKDGHNFSLSSDFSSYPVDLTDLTSEKLSTIANTMQGYILKDGKKPILTASTGSDKKLSFNVSSYGNGIYVILGETVTRDNVRYIPQAAITEMPCSDGEDGITYTASMEIKYTKEEIPVTPETTSKKVIKVWEDDSNASKARPDKIVVDLLQDGKVYKEETLSASNNWSYSWGKLESGHTYTVVEKSKVSNYTVKAEDSGNTTVLTNTYNPPKTPPVTPPHEDTKIPQTGAQWALVVILAGAGIILMAIGFSRRRSSRR